MNPVAIEVEIDHGKVTPVDGQALPEHARAILTVLESPVRGEKSVFSVVTDSDGLPVIRIEGGIITSALVREIEGLTR
jgi:hypothetical protein